MNRTRSTIATRMATTINTVRYWRRRWLGVQMIPLAELSVEERLADAPRPGAPARITPDQRTCVSRSPKSMQSTKRRRAVPSGGTTRSSRCHELMPSFVNTASPVLVGLHHVYELAALPRAEFSHPHDLPRRSARYSASAWLPASAGGSLTSPGAYCASSRGQGTQKRGLRGRPAPRRPGGSRRCRPSRKWGTGHIRAGPGDRATMQVRSGLTASRAM